MDDNTSGQGERAFVPPEIRRWNWGAFLLNWIWGIGNDTYIALLTMIPLVDIVMPFVLGAKGSEWAWRNKRWRDVAHFKRVQRNWAIAGVAVFGGWRLKSRCCGSLRTMSALLRGPKGRALGRLPNSS
jgi:hypothetical protein